MLQRLSARLTAALPRADNYDEPHGPRFAGSGGRSRDSVESIHVVSLNLQFARQIARAQEVFSSVDVLARADLLLLQEMDCVGTLALAAHLGMSYVYYPATVHVQTGRDFGNAVLSRWPITRDRKVVLPHHSLLDGSLRTATAVTVLTPAGPIDVCSLHLATALELLPGARRAQFRALLREVQESPRAIFGGDLNSRRLGRLAADDGFDWPTKDLGRTVSFLSADHLFSRGLRVRDAGKVTETLAATDHAAVWTTLDWH